MLTPFVSLGNAKGIYPTLIIILVSVQGTISKSSLSAPSDHEERASRRSRIPVRVHPSNADSGARELESSAMSVTTEHHQAGFPHGRVRSGTMLSTVVWLDS